MIHVREATNNDADSILALYDEFSRMLQANDVPSQVGKRELEEVLDRPDTHIFLAVNEADDAVGLLSFYVLPNIRHGYKRGHVEDFFVSEKARGAGVGQALFAYTKDFCRKNALPVIKLDSGNELLGAHRFYEKQGGKTSERFFRFDITPGDFGQS
jgi:GNAT superfamily N-acetyltransferase